MQTSIVKEKKGGSRSYLVFRSHGDKINMKRILHVVIGMDRGGIETLIMNIYRKIDRNKIQFDFLVHTNEKKSYDDEIYSLGGKIHRVSPRSKGIIKNKRELIDFFKKHPEYKTIHQHVSSLTYIQPIKIARRFNVPMRIIHGHSTKQGGHKVHKLFHNFNQLVIKESATHYFACSKDAAKWMYGKNQLNENRFSIVNNGIDSEMFVYNEELRDRSRGEYKLVDKMVIGHVGRFSYPKNHDFIIEVFEEIKKINEEAVLLLVGDGESRGYITRNIKERGLEDSVIMTGIRNDTESMLNAMDIFLFPSLYEGLGIAIIEAQSTGLKCFASTEIPKEALITDNVKSISLKKSPCYWAKEILKLEQGYKRESQTNQVKCAGYDIIEVVQWIQKLYLDK